MQRVLKIFNRGFWLHRAGTAAVEFSLLAPVLGALLLGLFDIGSLVYDRTDLHYAVRSGAQYFMAGGDSDDLARDLVTESWASRPESSTVTVVRCCKCAGIDAACGTLCPDQSVPDVFHNIEVTADFPGLFGTYPVTVSEMVRTR